MNMVFDSKLKVVIFDMDGTLIDSERLHKVVQTDVLSKFGIEFKDEDYVAFVGMPARDLWGYLRDKYDIDLSVDDLIGMNRKEYYRFLRNKEGVFLMDGVYELILEIKKRGFFVAIGTSAGRKTLDIVLDVFDLHNVFDFSVSADDVVFGKPNPEVFLKIADFFGVNSNECIVFEDAVHGIEAAKSAGMKCIAFVNRGANLQDVSKADFVLDDYEKFSVDRLVDIFNS